MAVTSVVGSIAATAVVVPVASFDGGSVRTLSILLAPGDSARVEPRDGVRTRMTYSVPTRVTVLASAFVGRDGRAVSPRLLCAHARAEASVPDVAFDCAAGWTAPMISAGASVRTIGIGATVSARDTRRLPAGLYTGTVTLLASPAGS